MKTALTRCFPAIALAALLASAHAAEAPWQPLFDGHSLEGWTPKIVGHPAGDNFARTFRADDGKIVVSYDGYGGHFNNRFGHLFYKQPFRYYRLRLQYRFVSSALPDTPDWAIGNSGIMFHGQSPESMGLDQDFPVSIEFQLLGRKGPGPRPTASVCTPGTTIYIAGKRDETHCIESKAPTFDNGTWVQAELDVLPNGEVIHYVNGKEVIRYDRIELDPSDPIAKPMIAARGGWTSLSGGTISLQSEGHPVEFRQIEVQKIAD